MGIRRNKRRYSSYQGTIGKVADNIIERNFFADKPNQKWYTDITEFNLRGEKVYLSPILDGYAGDIVSYNISRRPDFSQINDMLNKAFRDNLDTQELIFHSDQGAQYTAYAFRTHLEELQCRQSFSAPGYPYDNSVCESFFNTLKKEAIYYHIYDSAADLAAVLDEYIEYYNEIRMHRTLKMKTPSQVETEFFERLNL